MVTWRYLQKSQKLFFKNDTTIRLTLVLEAVGSWVEASQKDSEFAELEVVASKVVDSAVSSESEAG
jgi:hypothetical protein